LLGSIQAIADQPNILMIVTDDQAPWALGNAVNSDRNPHGRYHSVPAAATPNMDRLASEGLTFTNFFCTTPVCSPARAALATGRYASQLGIDDFIPKPGHKLFDPNDQVALDPSVTITFAEVLKSEGYFTGLVGKWHLGDWTYSGDMKNHPTNHGYDYFMGLSSGGTTPSDPVLEVDRTERKMKGLTTDILTDYALEFLDNAQRERRPFLLCFHTRAPHGAWLPVAPEDWEPYADLDPTIPNPDYPDLDTKKIKRDMREYLASTSGVDRNLGRLMDKLDTLKISERTVVIFTSDHGYNMGHNGIVHKGNGIWATKSKPPGQTHHGVRVHSNKYRPNLYDLSLKVPAIVRWPGVVPPNSINDHTVTSLDLFPTLLAIAQVPTPEKVPVLEKVPVPERLKLPGRDLSGLLQGDPPDDWEQDFFGQYSMVNYANATLRCYRTPDYKLIRDFLNDGCDEFYDLRTDPSESNNLINDSSQNIRAVIDDLHTKLLAKMQQIDDPALEHID
jgi:uncharacterized sulfatase